MNKKLTGAIVATTVAGLFLAGHLQAEEKDAKKDDTKVEKKADKDSCKGKDGCKGKGECKGKDGCKGKGECKGKDSCKGHDKSSCKGKDGCEGKDK